MKKGDIVVTELNLRATIVSFGKMGVLIRYMTGKWKGREARIETKRLHLAREPRKRGEK